MEQLDYRQSFEIGEDVFYEPTHDELVLLNLKSQQYYGLDVMGARIWHLLLEYRNVGTVTDRVCEEYDVERSRALCDVQAIVKDLIAAGLLKTHSTGPIDKL